MNNLPSLTYRFYISLLLLFAWAIPGCQSGVTRGNGQKGNDALLGKALLLPDTLAVIRNGQIVAEATGCVIDRAKATIVSSVWGDCHVCMARLNRWGELQRTGHLPGVLLVFIMVTSNPDHYLRVFYPEIRVDGILVFDKKGLFYQFNGLSNRTLEYNTFLLDEDFSVRLRGDPLLLPELMKSYENTLAQIANDV